MLHPSYLTNYTSISEIELSRNLICYMIGERIWMYAVSYRNYLGQVFANEALARKYTADPHSRNLTLIFFYGLSSTT